MKWSPRIIFIVILMLGLGVVPLLADYFGEPFYTVMFSRMLILSIGAVSLNLILGFGGMVSFGHAVYLGIGSYMVGIVTMHSVEDGIEWMANGFLQNCTCNCVFSPGRVGDRSNFTPDSWSIFHYDYTGLFADVVLRGSR